MKWVVAMVCAACSGSAPPPAGPASGSASIVSTPEVAWRWTGPPPTDERPYAVEQPKGTTVRYADGEVIKKETDSILWRTPIGTGANAAAFAFAPAGDVVFVAHYHRIASGAELLALAAADGKLLWRVRAEALGPVSHSQYLNAIELHLVDGAVVMFGWESGGRYIEAHDARTGAQRSNRRLGQP